MNKDKSIIHFGDVDIRILNNSSELTLAELLIPAGAIASIHQHPHEEINYVISGTIDCMCDGKITTLQAGESIHILPNQPHNIVCHPEASSKVITVWTPSRQDLMAKLDN